MVEFADERMVAGLTPDEVTNLMQGIRKTIADLGYDYWNTSRPNTGRSFPAWVDEALTGKYAETVDKSLSALYQDIANEYPELGNQLENSTILSLPSIPTTSPVGLPWFSPNWEYFLTGNRPPGFFGMAGDNVTNVAWDWPEMMRGTLAHELGHSYIGREGNFRDPRTIGLEQPLMVWDDILRRMPITDSQISMLSQYPNPTQLDFNARGRNAIAQELALRKIFNPDETIINNSLTPDQAQIIEALRRVFQYGPTAGDLR